MNNRFFVMMYYLRHPFLGRGCGNTPLKNPVPFMEVDSDLKGGLFHWQYTYMRIKGHP